MTIAKHTKFRTKTHRTSHNPGTNDRPIKRGVVDFGTYHHATPGESEEIRRRAEKAFSKLLRPLYASGSRLRIMDAGCGLGFLMAHIVGVDLFRRGSISGISMDKAANNMQSLGLDSRTSFLKHDLTKPM